MNVTYSLVVKQWQKMVRNIGLGYDKILVVYTKAILWYLLYFGGLMKKVVLAVKTVIFLIILAICLFAVSLVVERKSSYDKNQKFFEEAKKDHIDAFILGSSHVINGINPVQMYREHGYTSYNLGGFGSVHLSTYWQFRLALDYCTPKLVVIDSYMLENDVRYIDDPASNIDAGELHLNIDRFPLNKTKMEALDDMFENKESKYEFISDFIIYHDRWKELSSNDFKRLTNKGEYNQLMGAVMEYGLHATDFTYTDFQAGVLDHETVGTTYLKRIIEDCKERNIEVLVLTVPFWAMQDGQLAANTSEMIAAEYGVNALNLLKAPGLIDLNSDMADAGHLNILGARKVTEFLGAYIAQNYDLPDHRSDPDYSAWSEAVASYDNGIRAEADGNENIYSQLITLNLLRGEKTFAVSIRGGTAVYGDNSLIRQLRQLGAGEALERAVISDSSYMLISDHGQIFEFAGDGEGQQIATENLNIVYIPVSDIYRVLYCGDDSETNYLYSDEHAYADVQLLMFTDGEVSAHQYYTSDHFEYDYEEN